MKKLTISVQSGPKSQTLSIPFGATAEDRKHMGPDQCFFPSEAALRQKKTGLVSATRDGDLTGAEVAQLFNYTDQWTPNSAAEALRFVLSPEVRSGQAKVTINGKQVRVTPDAFATWESWNGLESVQG